MLWWQQQEVPDGVPTMVPSVTRDAAWMAILAHSCIGSLLECGFTSPFKVHVIYGWHSCAYLLQGEEKTYWYHERGQVTSPTTPVLWDDVEPPPDLQAQMELDQGQRRLWHVYKTQYDKSLAFWFDMQTGLRLSYSSLEEAFERKKLELSQKARQEAAKKR
ncbi:unnamed protein product, partial [Symbiodinium sp. CCMP2456]